MVGEFAFRCCNLMRKASCGEMLTAVEDDPDRLSDKFSLFSLFWPEPEMGTRFERRGIAPSFY